LRSLITCGLLGLGPLSACGGQQLAGTGTNTTAPGQSVFSRIAPPLGNCGGTHGVSVSPCPLIISKQSQGHAVFNVTGPGVINTYLKGYQLEGNCSNQRRGEICSVENLGSPPSYWGATSGPYCGKAKPLKFYAYGVSGFIGYANLEVINRYCP
jgi:hypothetical protein